MSTSFIYKSASIYELAMRALYGRHYSSRHRAIAELLPEGSSVLDLCCGPALLYRRYLRQKRVQYTGLDINEKFIAKLVARGVEARVWDLRNDDPLPKADYVMMQASLYHFMPGADRVVDRMRRAARKQVIIAEPIRNLTSSDSRLLSLVGRRFTDAGSGQERFRFTEASLASFFSRYSSHLVQSFLIAGGREKVYILQV